MDKRSHFLAILLVTGMVAVAGYTLRKEMIFPEVAALAFGAWVMEETPWKGVKLNLWLSPTLAALTGVLMMRFFPYSPFFMVAAAFMLVALQLALLRSSVMPSISAAILPLLLKCDSWYYLLCVCVFTGIIAAGRHLADRSRRRGNKDRAVPPGKWDAMSTESKTWPNEGNAGEREAAPGLAHWSKLLAALMAVSAVALGFHWIFVIAPPLIVSFVEISKPDGPLRTKLRGIFMLLSLAAFSGAVCVYLMHVVMHWPLWVPAGVSVLSVFIICELLQLHFPPAAAIALLPVIIPPGSLWSYPLNVALGSAVFILISALWFDGQKKPLRTRQKFLIF